MFLVFQTIPIWWTSLLLLNPRISNWSQKWLNHAWFAGLPPCNVTCAESVGKDIRGWLISAGIKDSNAGNYPNITAEYVQGSFIEDTNWQITTIPNTPLLNLSTILRIFNLSRANIIIFIERFAFLIALNTLYVYATLLRQVSKRRDSGLYIWVVSNIVISLPFSFHLIHLSFYTFA